ncbi:hypothetical protein C8F01DRAFT_35766 [Mycena amicta]|nr:hypothetical protein C8F01DRAFT_35766 [Mycena amicta]
MSTTSEIQAVGSNDESHVIAASDPAQYSGSFFHSSDQVSVTGGMFTSAQSVTNHFHHGPSVGVPPADFRKIPLGDINLQRELRVDDQSVSVYRRREHGCVHRVYSARVEGKKADMTVAIFQGENAEEQWSRTVLEHSSLRHPNVVQLFGVSSSSGVHATVYHDELIPFEHFLNRYCNSHFLLLDLWAYFMDEQRAAIDYFWSVFPRKPFPLCCGYWIHPSNGRICLDLLPSPTALHHHDLALHHHDFAWTFTIPRPNGIHTLNEPDREATFISSLTLAQYHNHCYWVLAEHREIVFSAPAVVKLGTVLHYSCSTRLKSPVEITSLLPDLKLSQSFWPWINETHRLDSNSGQWGQGGLRADGDIMENKWTRCDTRNDFPFNPSMNFWATGGMYPWLSQSDYVMNHLHASYNCEDYAVVRRIVFQIMIPTNSQPLPEGYLFLSPAANFEVGPSLFCWPECPAYWSLDPAGVERLSTKEAEQLGFPALDLTSWVSVVSWDVSAYAGIRNFQRAKGFNPYTQDVARALGHPLYNLPAEDQEFTHVVDEDLEEAVDSWTLIE